MNILGATHISLFYNNPASTYSTHDTLTIATSYSTNISANHYQSQRLPAPNFTNIQLKSSRSRMTISSASTQTHSTEMSPSNFPLTRGRYGTYNPQAVTDYAFQAYNPDTTPFNNIHTHPTRRKLPHNSWCSSM